MPGMRKILMIAGLIALGLFLTACEEDGELRIRNRTNGLVQASVDNGDEVSIDAWSGWSRFYAEDATVKVSFKGLYVYPDSTTRSIIKGLPTTVNVTPDAGALSIQNDSTFVIIDVYISSHNDTDWGVSQLPDDLALGATQTWTLDAGTWDIKIVNDAGAPLYKMNQSVVINETLSLNVQDFLPSAKAKRTGGLQHALRRPIAR